MAIQRHQLANEAKVLAEEERRSVVQEVIRQSELPRPVIARLAGVNETTVLAWLRRGKAARVPRPENVVLLADGLRLQGERLGRLADRLDSTLLEPGADA